MSFGLAPYGLSPYGLTYGSSRAPYALSMMFWRPNWSQQVVETLTFNTDIMRSRRGVEQRRSINSEPRQSFSFELMGLESDGMTIDEFLWGQPNFDFYWPNLLARNELTDEAPAGDDELELTTSMFGYEAGGYLLVWKSAAEHEFVQVSSVESGRVLLVDTLFDSWPAGTTVYPLMTARTGNEWQQRWLSNTLYTMPVTLTRPPGSYHGNLPAQSAPVTWNGYEVLTESPNWAEVQGFEFDAGMDVLDAGFGNFRYLARDLHPTATRGMKFTLNGRAEIYAFRAMVMRLRGRHGAIWVPDWNINLRMATSIAADSANLTVRGTALGLYVGRGKGRDNIRITLNDGTVFYRRLLDIGIASGNSLLLLDSPLGQAVDPADVARIDHLVLARLASDVVEIPYITDELATPTLYFTTLLQEPA